MRILIVEDETPFALILRQVLVNAGHQDVLVAHSAEQALKQADGVDVLITDLRLPGASGIELMQSVRRRDPGISCILMTAFADVATARQALTSGAIDYLVKPFDNRELTDLVQRISVPEAGDDRVALPGMVGESPVMRRIFANVRQVAKSDMTVLLLGQSGTGKELVAAALHRLSARAAKPMIDVHLAALAESTLENELFGHEPGAFTGAQVRKLGLFELANGGTLFLDEIGELPMHLQPKILRVLQERHLWRVGGTAAIPIDVRIVAATNRDLGAEVAAGRFRADLFYRLDVMTITLPALCERGADILLIANQLLAQRRPSASFTAAAAQCLRSYPWPGNVRELCNAIERADVLANGQRIDVVHLPERIAQARQQDPAGTMDHEERERELIRTALARVAGNKSLAAGLLGISRRRLYSRLKVLGMTEKSGPDA